RPAAKGCCRRRSRSHRAMMRWAAGRMPRSRCCSRLWGFSPPAGARGPGCSAGSRPDAAGYAFLTTAFTASTFDGSCPEVTWISRLLDAPAEEPTFTLTVITFEAPPLRSKVTVLALTALVMFDEPSKYE